MKLDNSELLILPYRPQQAEGCAAGAWQERGQRTAQLNMRHLCTAIQQHSGAAGIPGCGGSCTCAGRCLSHELTAGVGQASVGSECLGPAAAAAVRRASTVWTAARPVATKQTHSSAAAANCSMHALLQGHCMLGTTTAIAQAKWLPGHLGPAKHAAYRA